MSTYYFKRHQRGTVWHYIKLMSQRDLSACIGVTIDAAEYEAAYQRATTTDFVLSLNGKPQF